MITTRSTLHFADLSEHIFHSAFFDRLPRARGSLQYHTKRIVHSKRPPRSPLSPHNLDPVLLRPLVPIHTASESGMNVGGHSSMVARARLEFALEHAVSR